MTAAPGCMSPISRACTRGAWRRSIASGGASSKRLQPHRIAVAFRLLARNLALGLQIHEAGERPATLREPRAFRATHVEGLGLFAQQDATIWLLPQQPSDVRTWHLPWTHRTICLAA